MNCFSKSQMRKGTWLCHGCLDEQTENLMLTLTYPSVVCRRGNGIASHDYGCGVDRLPPVPVLLVHHPCLDQVGFPLVDVGYDFDFDGFLYLEWVI